MASLLSDYIKKERLLEQLKEELKALENNSELKKEIEFKKKVTGTYGRVWQLGRKRLYHA